MVLFFSDMHLGHGTAAREREVERDLLACLDAYADVAEHLYLVGDVFEAYLEYPSLIPKGFVRLMGRLAAWTDRGVPVTYLTGNHDPWHLAFFHDELGVRVADEPLLEPSGGHLVYLSHGDAHTVSEPLYQRLRPWLRHPAATWLYRSLLPADAGYRLARWYSRRFSDEILDPTRIDDLRRHAAETLCTTPATLVVMGHSHHAELVVQDEGAYLNTGAWYENRTFGCLDEDGVKLMRWNDPCAEVLDACILPATAA